ncbi:MAG: hypothetical protein Q9222_000681 [Ikaeria aurantiellina]
MSELQGAWVGKTGFLADPEERRVLFATLDSFRQYRKVAHFNVTHWRRQKFYALPSTEWKLLSGPPFNFLALLEQVDDAIDVNAEIAMHILETGLQSFGLDQEQPDGMTDWRGCATPADMDKARSTMRQLFRDWSAEGAAERNATYGPVLRDLASSFGHVLDLEDVNILVPGAGLGRLVFELCKLGFTVEGNEVSYHQLIAGSWVLNHTKGAKQYMLLPFASDFSNVVSRAHQLRPIMIPDEHPATALIEASPQDTHQMFDGMRMTAGDFIEVYGDMKHAELYDAVATVFFLDTAPNVIRYIETVYHCLKQDGIWVNNGPLLWHWADRGPSQHDIKLEGSDQQHDVKLEGSDHHQLPGQSNLGSVELSVQEVVLLIQSMGFEVENKGIRANAAGYMQNPDSMLQNLYKTSHWVAKKIPRNDASIKAELLSP